MPARKANAGQSSPDAERRYGVTASPPPTARHRHRQRRGNHATGNRFLQLAVLYLIAGVTFGIVMAASGDHSLAPVTAVTSILLGLGVLCFAANLWRHTGLSGSA